MYFIGLMSGTSMDAIDAVLIDIADDQLELVEYQQFPIPSSLQSRIRNAASDMTIHEMTELDVEMAELFAKAVVELLRSAGVVADDIAAIGSHGQTVLHLPDATLPRTLQIGDPSIIAIRTGITTVADFRRSDMAAGGQGAPLAPLFHDWKFREPGQNRVVLNLGGMANITILPAEGTRPVTGFDTGPGNALMDTWIQHQLGKDYDENGAWALSGKVDNELLAEFLSDSYFQLPPPKSTGKDAFNIDWLTKERGYKGSPEDMQITLLELTAVSISNAIDRYAPKTDIILVCGGGIHNKVLYRRLQALNKNRQLDSTEAYGVHPDAVEATVFAWLAHRRLDNRPGNLAAVTGAVKPVLLGGIYGVD